MKKSILIFLLSTLCLVRVHSQLNIEHNRFRPGDMLFKQQVEYVDPGEAGSDKLWNFGKPKIINDEYTLEYAVPPLEYDSIYIMGERRFKKGDVRENELIVGTEHNTMYYYHLKEDSLLQIGHENPSVVLAYTSPMVLLRFPLNYGETVSSDYRSKGLYSGTVDIRTEGTVTVTADAYGKMILPTKDTLDLVLRVKTLQTIFDSREENTGSPEAENTGRQLEIYRWYGKGYRYPVFETMRNLSLPDSSVFFSTAFFFPPQDHFYLETDSANLALLDQLWNLDKDNIDHPGEEHTDVVNLKDVLSCKIYPNPVSSILNLEYELKRDAGVSFRLFSIDGTAVKAIDLKKKSKGRYHDTLDCSSLHGADYVLRITANDLVVNEVIIKK